MSRRFHIDPNERDDIYEFDPDEIISDTPPNVITIRARMNVEIAGRVTSEIAKLGADNKTTEVSIGAQSVALLLHNILAWRGPDFDGLPCTPENIRCLPSASSDPFIEKVVNAIGERNRKRESPNARSAATPSTSESDGAVGSNLSANADERTVTPRSISLQLATTTTRSPLRSALDGYQKRSDDSTPTI